MTDASKLNDQRVIARTLSRNFRTDLGRIFRDRLDITKPRKAYPFS